MRGRAGQVIGVIGGSGGVGASTFAAILAVAAGAAVLVDLDVASGGLDVLLGLESEPGARWSGLRLAGGRLDPELLREGLPRAGPCALLAADTAELAPDAVLQVLDAATTLGTVVLDLPRASCAARAAALLRCDLLVLVARADVAGLVAAHAVVHGLPDLPTGLVPRGEGVDAAEAARLVGVPLLGALPGVGRGPRVDVTAPPRTAARVAAGIVAGLPAMVAAVAS